MSRAGMTGACLSDGNLYGAVYPGRFTEVVCVVVRFFGAVSSSNACKGVVVMFVGLIRVGE